MTKSQASIELLPSVLEVGKIMTHNCPSYIAVFLRLEVCIECASKKMYDQSDFESPTFDVTQFVDQLVEKSLSGSSTATGGTSGPSSAAFHDEFDSAKLYSVLSQVRKPDRGFYRSN